VVQDARVLLRVAAYDVHDHFESQAVVGGAKGRAVCLPLGAGPRNELFLVVVPGLGGRLFFSPVVGPDVFFFLHVIEVEMGAVPSYVERRPDFDGLITVAGLVA